LLAKSRPRLKPAFGGFFRTLRQMAPQQLTSVNIEVKKTAARLSGILKGALSAPGGLSGPLSPFQWDKLPFR
jgi:hypothetical protein